MDSNMPYNGTLESKVQTRFKLSALWAALMFLYLYADVFSLYRPGQVDKLAAGQIGPFAVSQGTLLIFSTLMLIPALMVFLSLALKPGLARWLCLILGAVYTLVNLSNLLGETWAYYILYGVVEIGLTALIVIFAWRWRPAKA